MYMYMYLLAVKLIAPYFLQLHVLTNVYGPVDSTCVVTLKYETPLFFQQQARYHQSLHGQTGKL